MAAISEIGKARLRDDVYTAMKEAILLLDYRPGQSLSLRALADTYGVSATPIREVLIRLEAEGLVKIEPRNSAHVTEVSIQDVVGVTEVRLALADQIGTLAAQRATEEDLQALEALIGRMEKENRRRALTALDSEFHQRVDAATKNQHLAWISGLLRNQVVRLWFLVPGEISYWPEMRAGRVALVSALRRRDESECRTNLREHVLQFARQLEQTVLRGGPT
ncbi:MAG: GntR family transcriptional regulator [Thermotogota bacterium]